MSLAGAEMFEYARSAAAAAPAGSLPALVLPWAHWEIYYQRKRGGDENYFRDPDVWSEARGVYANLLEAFPESTELLNWYARTASLAGDSQSAKEAFSRIGDRWSRRCWGSLTAFEAAREKALPESPTE